MRLLAICLLLFTSTSLISEENPKMFSPKEVTSTSINLYNCKSLGGNFMSDGFKGSGIPPDDTKVNVSFNNNYIYVQKIYVNKRDDRYTGYPRGTQTRKSEISGTYYTNLAHYNVRIKRTSEETYFVSMLSFRFFEDSDTKSLAWVDTYECKTE